RADEAAVTRARAEVTNEYLATVVNEPFGDVRAMVHASLFPSWHPYHHLPIGTPASTQRITLADARAWVATWYGPANTTLVIAGKVDPAAAMALVERYFGSLPAHSPPARPLLPPLGRRGPLYLHVATSAARSQVRLAWVTPPLGTTHDLALDVAATIL